jgi:fused signal recognition particle receptor
VTIHDQLAIPPRFLGTGEEPGEFRIFEKESFVAEVL